MILLEGLNEEFCFILEVCWYSAFSAVYKGPQQQNCCCAVWIGNLIVANLKIRIETTSELNRRYSSDLKEATAMPVISAYYINTTQMEATICKFI